MTEAEIEPDIAQKAPGGAPGDTDERQAAHETRIAARDEILAERQKDRAGGASRDETVAAVFATTEQAAAATEGSNDARLPASPHPIRNQETAMPRDEDIDAGYSGPGGGGYGGNPRGEPSGFSGGGWNSVTEGGDRDGYRQRPRPLPPEMLALRLADGRLLGDVAGLYGLGVFPESGLRLADGRLVADVIRPYHLGGFGGFKTNKDARAQFAAQQRMRKERLAALSRLGFGKTVRTGPRGVAANVPAARSTLDSG